MGSVFLSKCTCQGLWAHLAAWRAVPQSTVFPSLLAFLWIQLVLFWCRQIRKDGWTERPCLSADLALISGRFVSLLQGKPESQHPGSSRCHHSCQVFLMRWETKGQCSGNRVQTSNVTFQSEVHFESLCHWGFVTFLLGWACVPRITVTATGSISPSKCVFVSSVSSHFLEDLLNEASASADMQQTCRKASYGSVPGMSLTLILAASCKGIIREHSYAHSCTGCTAWRPFSWVVKPARKQGWTYSGKSTMLPSTFFFVLNWLTSAICQTQKKAALLQVCVVLEKLQ